MEDRVSYDTLYLVDRAPSELGWDTEYPPLMGDVVVLLPQNKPEGRYRVVDRQWSVPCYGSAAYRDEGRSCPTLDLLVEEVKGMYADEK